MTFVCALLPSLALLNGLDCVALHALVLLLSALLVQPVVFVPLYHGLDSMGVYPIPTMLKGMNRKALRQYIAEHCVHPNQLFCASALGVIQL